MLAQTTPYFIILFLFTFWSTVYIACALNMEKDHKAKLIIVSLLKERELNEAEIRKALNEMGIRYFNWRFSEIISRMEKNKFICRKDTRLMIRA